ncbi:MAG: hypothetical protein AB1489_10460 [Acidobacteriota bacterium]
MRGRLCCGYLILLLCCLACQSNAPTERAAEELDGKPTPYEGSESPQIFILLKSGSLKLGRIIPLAEKVEAAAPFGQLISFSVKNETGEQFAFRIDCGTVLRARDNRFQDLIVSRSTEGLVAPYALWTGKLEVFALQLRRYYPLQPTEYQLGHLANGELRRFVECFCFNRPDVAGSPPLDLTPAQYAVWCIADKVTLSQVINYARERGKPNAEEQTVLEQQAREQGNFAQKLLEDCRSTAKFLD